MTHRRLLLVNYFYPPVPSNTARWASMARHLGDLGYEISVLTTGAFGPHADDCSREVVRTRDAITLRPLRALLRRPPLSSPDGGIPLEKPPSYLLTRVIVPDMYLLTWGPWALGAARRLIRERQIDCVVTSTPVESTAVLGAMLSRRVAWLCDLRDPWTFESLRPGFPTRPQRRLDAALESWTLRRADAVTAVQQASVDDLLSRLNVDAVRVPNGWDPPQEPPAEALVLPPTANGFRVVHTGMLGGEWGRNPRPFLEAARRVHAEDPRLRLILAGRLTIAEQALLQGADLGSALVHVGQLPRVEALALQRSANLLVAIGSHRRSEAPGKVVEYLGAGRPILVLGRHTESARVVGETGTGRAVAHDDVDAIAAALRDAIAGRLAAEYAPRNLDGYRYPAVAHAMARQIERAVLKAAARGAAAPIA